MRRRINQRLLDSLGLDEQSLEVGKRYNEDFKQDDNGLLLCRGSRPSHEPLAVVITDSGWVWDGDDEALADWPLYGRPFIHTVFDCFTFVRDLYWREYGIELPTVVYEDGWWNRGEDLYATNARRAGFYEVSAPLQVGDVVAFSVDADRINHIAVYLGDKQIAHHKGGMPSIKEPFKPSMLKRVWSYHRHEKLT